MALPAADRTQPALKALTTTTVPAATESAPAACPPSVMLARAPSEARSRIHTVPALADSTATTVRAAPADRIITGAATETATGSMDSALASDRSDGWARTEAMQATRTQAATSERRRRFMRV